MGDLSGPPDGCPDHCTESGPVAPTRACLSMMSEPMRQPIGRLDRRLLALLEEGLPLVRRPWNLMAERLGCPQQQVLDRLSRLRSSGLLRRIAGIFDAAALGYAQTLIAMRIEPDRLDGAAAAAAGHPGVSHCYGRTGRFNLWFTLAVSPDSRLGLCRTVDILADRCEAQAVMNLPAVRRYKLDVRFAAANRRVPTEPQPAPAPPGRPTAQQIRAIGALQQDLPAEDDPFARLARVAGIDPDMLLVHAADFLTAGWMRRYAAVIHHRAAGAQANVLVAWQIDDKAADRAGEACAADQAVSHCYLRATAQDWPYNLYTMIHAADRPLAQRMIDNLAAVLGEPPHLDLWTAKEYAKRRIGLFDGSERKWEQGCAGN